MRFVLNRLARVIAAVSLAMVLAVPGVVAQEDEVSFMVFGDPAELAAYQSLAAAFEEAYPDIELELIHIPSASDYRARLGVDFAAGDPADVVLINYRRYAPFAAMGALEPLAPYLRASDVIGESDFFGVATDPFKWRGQLLCIPQNISSLVVYYNRALFDEAGLPYPEDDWTQAEFLETAKALTRDTDGDGEVDQYGLGTEPSIFRLAPFVWGAGGELVVLESGLRPIRLALDSRAAREAVEWFVELQTVHGVVPDAVAETAESSESRFLNGRTAMFLNSRRGTPTARAVDGLDWDVAALPIAVEPASILHSDAYCMAAATEDKDAAWTFIEYANSPEGQAIVAGSGRTVPSLKAVASSEAFLDPSASPANSAVWLETVDTLRTVPVMAAWVDIEELTGDELERAFYGQASVDEVIDAMIARTAPFFAGEEG